MEDKLISSQWLINDLLNKSFYPAIVKSSIESAPAIDAVPVVRCKDCIKQHTLVCPMEDMYNHGIYEPCEDSFCSHGRKERPWPNT